MDQNLKQQKFFAFAQIIGGLLAAGVLAYSYLLNVMAGHGADGMVTALAVMALGSFAFAGWALRRLSKIARYEQEARNSQ